MHDIRGGFSVFTARGKQPSAFTLGKRDAGRREVRHEFIATASSTVAGGTAVALVAVHRVWPGDPLRRSSQLTADWEQPRMVAMAVSAFAWRGRAPGAGRAATG